MDDPIRSCWCGASDFREFGPNYLRCDTCHTLVDQVGLTDEETLVRDDQTDYYGKRYWLEHQREALKLPDIYARARQDLPERCVYWLKTLLRYRRPPARILEIGAGHGAYTALLRAAGFDATALDLSPWVAEFARVRFGIPYLTGPVEKQKLRRRSFDVVVANDVLEHLADPVATIQRCAELLKPSGILVVQTPEYPKGRSYDELVNEDNLFLEHMRRAWREHLYLFNRDGLMRLLKQVGLTEVAFEEPVYPYDMLCVASSKPLSSDDGDPADAVAGGAAAPIVVALIDAHDAEARSNRDRAARLVTIELLQAALENSTAELEQSEADRAARLEVIGKLEAALKTSEADRAKRLIALEKLDAALTQSQAALKTSQADRAKRLTALKKLDAALKQSQAALTASEADRAALLDSIGKLEPALGVSEAGRAKRLDTMQPLEAALKESEADRAALLDAIGKLEATLKTSEADRARRLAALKKLDAALTQSQAALKESEADRAKRLDAMQRLEAALMESEADRSARLDTIKRLNAALTVSEDDRQARLELIERLDEELNAARRAQTEAPVA